MKRRMKQYVSLAMATSFWFAYGVVTPRSVAAAGSQLYIAPVAGSDGRVNGFAAGITIPFGFGRKAQAEKVQTEATKSEPRQYAGGYTPPRGYRMGEAGVSYPEKVALIKAIRSGRTKASVVDYFALLKTRGANITSEDQVMSYLESLEVKTNSTQVKAQLGRMVQVNNDMGISAGFRVDDQFFRNLAVGEKMLVDPKLGPVVSLHCGNVILKVMDDAVAAVPPPPPAPVAAPAPPPAPKPEAPPAPTPPPAPAPAVAPTPAPAQVEAPPRYVPPPPPQYEEQRWRYEQPAITQTVIVEQREKKHGVLGWVLGGLALIGVIVIGALLLCKKGDTTTNNATNTTTVTPPVDDPHPPVQEDPHPPPQSDPTPVTPPTTPPVEEEHPPPAE